MNLKSTILAEFDELCLAGSMLSIEAKEYAKKFLSSALDRLGQECLEAVPEQSLEEDSSLNSADDFRRLEKLEMWNSVRQSLLQSLQSNGVEVK